MVQPPKQLEWSSKLEVAKILSTSSCRISKVTFFSVFATGFVFSIWADCSAEVDEGGGLPSLLDSRAVALVAVGMGEGWEGGRGFKVAA